jgi:predicted TIM-barrel fold metal-dependent hydrolase
VSPLHGKAALAELERCFERGAKGIKLNPRKHGGYPLNNEELDPLMRLARELDIPVITHTDTNDIQCTPYQARMLALRHPEVTLIVAHFGLDGTAIHWVPEVVKDAPNIVLDCSATPDMPYYVFNRSCQIIGADRILFASDSPDLSPEVNLVKLQVAEEEYGLSKEDKRKILGENAARVLKLDK